MIPTPEGPSREQMTKLSADPGEQKQLEGAIKDIGENRGDVRGGLGVALLLIGLLFKGQVRERVAGAGPEKRTVNPRRIDNIDVQLATVEESIKGIAKAREDAADSKRRIEGELRQTNDVDARAVLAEELVKVEKQLTALLREEAALIKEQTELFLEAKRRQSAVIAFNEKLQRSPRALARSIRLTGDALAIDFVRPPSKKDVQEFEKITRNFSQFGLQTDAGTKGFAIRTPASFWAAGSAPREAVFLWLENPQPPAMADQGEELPQQQRKRRVPAAMEIPAKVKEEVEKKSVVPPPVAVEPTRTVTESVEKMRESGGAIVNNVLYVRGFRGLEGAGYRTGYEHDNGTTHDPEAMAKLMDTGSAVSVKPEFLPLLELWCANRQMLGKTIITQDGRARVCTRAPFYFEPLDFFRVTRNGLNVPLYGSQEIRFTHSITDGLQISPTDFWKVGETRMMNGVEVTMTSTGITARPTESATVGREKVKFSGPWGADLVINVEAAPIRLAPPDMSGVGVILGSNRFLPFIPPSRNVPVFGPDGTQLPRGRKTTISAPGGARMEVEVQDERIMINGQNPGDVNIFLGGPNQNRQTITVFPPRTVDTTPDAAIRAPSGPFSLPDIRPPVAPREETDWIPPATLDREPADYESTVAAGEIAMILTSDRTNVRFLRKVGEGGGLNRFRGWQDLSVPATSGTLAYDRHVPAVTGSIVAFFRADQESVLHNPGDRDVEATDKSGAQWRYLRFRGGRRWTRG